MHNTATICEFWVTMADAVLIDKENEKKCFTVDAVDSVARHFAPLGADFMLAVDCLRK